MFCIPFANGCSTEGQIIGGAIGATAVLGSTPGHQLEQVYYLGMFDPQEQVPPTVYRVTVRGQASSFSLMKFGSGWVPAKLVDSLSSRISFGDASKSNNAQFEKGTDEQMAALKTGRRMVMFGPEGFREAPADHRLVIVMGASPEEYFGAMDSVIGDISQAQSELSESEVKDVLLQTFLDIQSEQGQLKDLNHKFELENAQQQVMVVEQEVVTATQQVAKAAKQVLEANKSAKKAENDAKEAKAEVIKAEGHAKLSKESADKADQRAETSASTAKSAVDNTGTAIQAVETSTDNTEQLLNENIKRQKELDNLKTRVKDLEEKKL